MMMLARSAFVVLLLGVMVQSARAGQGAQHDAKSCFVEVLDSEELPAAPPFYRTVKARLLVTPADRAAFETTVARAFPGRRRRRGKASGSPRRARQCRPTRASACFESGHLQERHFKVSGDGRG